MKGAYIHIPFCEHICYYCDFNKVFIKNQPVDDYLDALEKEIARSGSHPNLETIYIGGGTPTALDTQQFNRLLKIVKKYLLNESIIEYTVEANPENVTPEKLHLMKENGVTRLSIGVQTFQDEILENIGRIHHPDDAAKAVEEAKKAGFENISIDLMFGLPNQTEDMLISSIQEALKLQTEHISIYSLQIEPKTIFFNRLKKGKLTLPGQELEAQMFETLIRTLEEKGFSHYEISNFAKPGFESRHNSIYWQNEPYYGFGAGSHGYIYGQRVVNSGPINKYIQRVNKRGHACTATHQVSITEAIEEEMFLGLRMKQGVNKQHFYEKFGRQLNSIYNGTIKDLKQKGLLEEDEDRVALTHEGLFLGNDVFSSFLIG
ncbi:oxygen-independent coproporphyrinogen III oxidase [Terrilactibacillus sp. BCM23-1]|uniref:Heme chaperone HemW n=1 Tax=Terrilactibacillus tamarindi TaxID=2599694 RepID=A0A6N8CQK4_9BACI|nr:radical SAM family heme chaperone HemW [Terrilactibacillus tamarindi]MTT32499.1 oxygen-independent coproporphyrinogen III oxidase [Terrilactibacillus tamarindi]